MRVFVTGAIGFVGQWLEKELRGSGHEVVAAPGPDVLDIADKAGLVRWLDQPSGVPDAVIHLAGMAFAPDAFVDPREAFRVNVGGTVALFEALREIGIRPPVLVTCSADAYGAPRPEDLPLREDAPLAPNNAYGLSKVAQEGAAAEASARYGFPVIVTRAFNHTGPGQRPVFVVPAMAQRVMAMKRGQATSIPAGNLDVGRDLTDVRDVVVAYRLLVQASAKGELGDRFTVVNVASGEVVTVRSLILRLCALAGVTPAIEIDPSLVRTDDPPEIRGDSALIRQLVGWEPCIPLERTLADVLATA
ncbi:MAG: GDP-mannose 4,6-dehydratase [Candidatus Limnocylindrales bacterium]|jgi:GDP-4-dehydro-6-deoxy-D-mannose reductase